MTELACQFGEQGRLNGVLTRPDDSCPDLEIVLVLVSAGLTAKAGPYRLYAELARELRHYGVSTLRFDLGGIANSEQIDPKQSLRARTHIDISSAVDFVSGQLGPKKIILGGLCSGAEDSFRYASADSRVSGVVLLDPHAFPTLGTRIYKYLSRHCFNWVVCKALKLAGILPTVGKKEEKAMQEGYEGDLVDYQYMPHEEATRILRELLERDVEIHYIYTGGAIRTFNYRRQFSHMFNDIEGLQAVRLTHVPHIEHVQVFEEDRREVVALVSGWVRETFCRAHRDPERPAV